MKILSLISRAWVMVVSLWEINWEELLISRNQKMFPPKRGNGTRVMAIPCGGTLATTITKISEYVWR